MRVFLLCLLAAALLAGCQSPPVDQTPQPVAARPTGELTLYRTVTPSPTPGQPTAPLTSPTPLPSPTPTPRTHTVARGEDLFGIALRYQVTLDALMQLNPTIEPHLLLVGTELKVPAPMVTPAGATPQPTAIPIAVRPPNCWPAADGGVWCFLLAANEQDYGVESLSAVVRLAPVGGEQLSKTAFALLNFAPAGGSLPLAAYFPPPDAAPGAASAEITAALPVDPASGRYLPMEVEGELLEMRAGGRAATVQGSVRLTEEEGAAGTVWVAAAAVDEAGRLVGVRRWESPSGLQAGQELEFSFPLYSQAGEIASMQLWAEARP